jgi:DNA-directed RNA polymerase sigma subunit (sigma70/sigma32)
MTTTISYERVVEGPDALRLYLKEISKFPQLTPEEEKELGARVQKGDEDAFRKLIEANLRFVVAMAKKYSVGLSAPRAYQRRQSRVDRSGVPV